MAAALAPYYKARTRLDLVILVSDEGENAAHGGYAVCGIVGRVPSEVNPNAKLLLVSFLPNDASQVGTIKQRLNEAGLGEDVMQYRFDINRPDTTKFDVLLSLCGLNVELIKQRKRKLSPQTLWSPTQDCPMCFWISSPNIKKFG